MPQIIPIRNLKNTAEISEKCGAHVYKREDTEHIGKGYALCELRKHINKDYPDGFDGYFVFDADNILDERFIEEMNNEFNAGNEVVTGFRNTKNFGDNWVSAAYGLLFLRESELLNYPREVLGLSCFVSGTGYCFSRMVADEIGDWPFHLLTEDAQFSIDSINNNRKIHYCRSAVFYDEQPTKFSQAWIQRLRWCKGYWQVFAQYGKDLLSGIFHGNFACYDMTMAIMPAFILTSLSVVSNIGLIVSALLTKVPLYIALFSIGSFLFSLYFTAFLVGAVLTVYEWKHIRMSAIKKIMYLFTFPIFMLSFCPIAIQSIFVKPEWKCIEHTRTVGDINNH